MKTLKLLGAALAALGLGLGPAAAQDFPSDTIHLIVPYPAGGGTDAIGRAVAAALEEATGASVVVDNIAGASGATGTLAMLQSKPDGYTAMLNGSSDLTSSMTFQQLPFSLDDFRYVGAVMATPTWVVAPAERGYETLADLLADAEANPDQVTIGVGGAAGAHALVAHAIKGHSGAPVRVVNYQGGAPLRKGLLANEVSAGVIHSPIMMDAIKEGGIKVLATAQPLGGISYEPVRDTPLLETFDIPVNVGVTRGVFLPKDTPDAVVAKFSEMLEAASQSGSLAAFGEKFGFAPTWMTGADFEALMREESEQFADIRDNIIAQ